jgi:hypothetical protein
MKFGKMILLFGMPRSGTTWVGKMFDSHRNTFYLHEPDSVEANHNIPMLLSQEALENSSYDLPQQISQWLKCKNEKVIASRPFFTKSYMNTAQWQLFQLSSYAIKALARANIKTNFQPIRSHKKSAPPTIVWKSIESLGRIGVFSEVTGAFPIQIIRHPCGNIASTFKGEQSGKFDGSVKTEEDWAHFSKLLEQTQNAQWTLEEIKQMKPEERLTIRWGLINDFAMKQVNARQGSALVYEKACHDPLKVISSVFEQAELELDTSTKAFIEESTSGHDSAYYATKKNPLTSAYSWKKSLNQQQIDNVKAMMRNFESGTIYESDF